MNPFEQMELKKASFTKRERQVYELVINNIDDILRDSATQLADNHKISQSSITRFCQKLGYNGYNDFKFDIYKYSKSGKSVTDPDSVMDYYSQIIHQIPNAVSKEQFRRVAEMICTARFTVCTGYHKSFLPAQLLDMNLHKMGILSSAIAYDSAHTLPQMLCKDDLVVIFSGVSDTYKLIADLLLDQGDNCPKMVLVTTSDKHVLKNKVDEVVWLPSYQNQGYPQYLESQVINFVFTDQLSSYIAEYKNK